MDRVMKKVAGMTKKEVMSAEAAIQNLKIFEIKMAKRIANVSIITSIYVVSTRRTIFGR